MTELLGLHPEVFYSEGIIRLFLRLCLDLIFTAVVVFGCYMRNHGRNEYIFTYMMFNIITFTLCFTLRQVPIELGFALGLFAIFGILRYRTEAIRTHDLTYLFVVIGIGILNAVVNEKISIVEVLMINTIITVATVFLEGKSFKVREEISITYQGIGGLGNPALLEELRTKTGLFIQDYKIESINIPKDTARIRVSIQRGVR
jgi:hypothetical protein